MRKSVLGILGIAALAASSLAVDSALARGHGGGHGGPGGGGGGGPSFSHGGGPSFSHAGGNFSGGGGRVHSSGRMSGSVASPSFQSNRSVGSASASASAFSGNRSFSGGNFNRHHGDFRHHHHHRGNFAFAAVPFGFYDDGYYNDYAYDYDGCYQLRRVHTRYGWRLRRIDVCNYAY